MVHSCIFMWALKTYISPPLRHPNSRNVRVQRRLPFSRANKSRDRNSRNGEKPKSFRHSHFDSMLKWWFHAWRFGLVSGSQGNSRAPKSPIHICVYIYIYTHTYIYIYKHIQCIYMYIFIVILRSLFRYTRRPALMGKWLFFQLLNLFATSEVNAVWQMWCQWCLHHKIVPKSGCILVWWKARKHKLQRCFRFCWY